MYKGCLSREVYDISTNAEGVTQSLEVGRGKRETETEAEKHGTRSRQKSRGRENTLSKH